MMNRLLTLRETADLLSASPSTVRRHVRNLGFPCHRIGGRLKFMEKEVEEWIENHKIKNQMKARIYNRNLQNRLTKDSQARIEEVKGDEMARSSRSRRNHGYGSVYVRMTSEGVPRFYIDFRDRTGRRVQRLVPMAMNWDMAKDALRDAVLKEHYSEYGVKEQKQIRFRKVEGMFIENYSKVNKRSWKDDFYRLRKCSDFFGNVNLDEVSPLDLEKLKSSMLKAGISKSTINRHLAILKTFYNVAIEWGYANQNPVKGVKFFSEKDTLRQRILTAKEEDRLLEAASEHLKPILIIALHTGMRRGEVLSLQWSPHIDFETREIRVEETKSGKPRIVDINSRLFNELMRLKNENQNNRYVFVNPKTGKPYRKLQTSFDGACRRAGIEGLRFHDLRHTFASRLVEEGVDLIRVKELLGHSTVKITERYTHSSREERKKAVELLCQKPPQRDQKRYNLLHHGDMEKGKKKSEPVSSLFSMN